jgi:glycosyltransferase involved in cell wall biosynthesis
MQKNSKTGHHKKTRIIFAVTNDLSTDQRVHKVITSLLKKNTEITLVGRKLKNSLPIERPYQTVRFSLPFNKGALFYATFNLRLFFYLLFSRFDLVVANDLDTLPGSHCAVKIRRKKLVYDSHEYFTEVPELHNRPMVKKIWTAIEENIFPKLNKIYTVNQSIANIYSKKYNKKIAVIRNVSPVWHDFSKESIQLDASLKDFIPYVILQGAGININRGAEELVDAFCYIKHLKLIIVGGGDVLPVLEKKVVQKNLEKKVILLGKKNYQELMKITAKAFLGVSLDKNTNLNYQYSLPNKIFDYIQAGVPILASRLTEIEKIITHYNIGDFIDNHDPGHIAKKINEIYENQKQYNIWKHNIKKAATELCWENQEELLYNIYDPYLHD